MKICLKCKKELSLEDFYSNGYYKGKKKYKPNCKICEYNRRYELHLKNIIIIVGELVCCKCGYNKNYAALEFHHLNPDKKEFRISQAKTCSLEKLRTEIEGNCILICSNCHREVHNPRLDLKILLGT